jgi:hypothetical protein
MDKFAFTISTFCKAHEIGRNTYYKLKKEGRGPREARIGSKVLITLEAAQAWREQISGEPVK